MWHKAHSKGLVSWEQTTAADIEGSHGRCGRETGGVKLANCVLPTNFPYCVNHAYPLVGQQTQQQSRARNLWDIKFYRLRVERG